MSVTVPRISLGLLHSPILDRKKEIIATNITNFDIHDIARACKVYGVQRYYLIHPMQEQLMFVDRVLDHWRVGEGAHYNPSRRIALEDVRTASSLEEAIRDWGVSDCLKIATHARPVEGTRHWTIADLRTHLAGPPETTRPVFLLFGTGYGMPDSYMQKLDGVLESIRGAPPRDFRHLSVRSAVSIYLDRVLGPW